MENRWKLAVCAGVISQGPCAAIGSHQEDQKRREKILNSPQYNRETGRFQNRRPDVMREMSSAKNYAKMLREYYSSSGAERFPKHPLPEVKPDLKDFLNPSAEGAKFIWLGHSSFLLNRQGRVMLFDPVFNSAAPVSFMVKRFQKAILEVDELPPIDYVVLSHDHYDHLDFQVMRQLASRQCQFLVPLGVGAHLRYWGIANERITEMDWWESTQVSGLHFTATPAQHFSGRGLSDRNKSLWCSWVIEDADWKMFFSGDSGYDIHFKEIGEKKGPFDLTFMENGQYNKLWQPVHMLPEETAQAQLDLRGRLMVPIHWGMFELSTHSWREPIERISAEAKRLNLALLTPLIGQVVDTTKPPAQKNWWSETAPAP